VLRQAGIGVRRADRVTPKITRALPHAELALRHADFVVNRQLTVIASSQRALFREPTAISERRICRDRTADGSSA